MDAFREVKGLRKFVQIKSFEEICFQKMVSMLFKSANDDNFGEIGSEKKCSLRCFKEKM